MVMKAKKEHSWIEGVTINCQVNRLEAALWANTGIVHTYKWYNWNSSGLLHLLGNGTFRDEPAASLQQLQLGHAELGWWKSQNGQLVLSGTLGRLYFSRMAEELSPWQLFGMDCADKWLILTSTAR
jgi:hypothetical protein